MSGQVSKGHPRCGQVQEDCRSIDCWVGRWPVQCKAILIDIAMGSGHDALEAVFLNLSSQFLDALLVEVEAPDSARPRRGGRKFLRRLIMGERCCVPGIVVEDCSCGRVSKATAACPSFDESGSRCNSQALEDVAVVGCVDDLGPMR